MNGQGRWVISTLFWLPLLGWVLWPLFDARLAWVPWVSSIHLAVLVIGWAYSGRFGLLRYRWPAVLSIGTAFNVALAVAERTTSIGFFFAHSLIGGALLAGLVCILIVVVAVRVMRVRNYGALEDWLLSVAPAIEAAMATGIAAGAFIATWGHALAGLLVGAAAGALAAILTLGWVYGLIGLTAFWLDRLSGRTEISWPEVFQIPGDDE